MPSSAFFRRYGTQLVGVTNEFVDLRRDSADLERFRADVQRITGKPTNVESGPDLFGVPKLTHIADIERAGLLMFALVVALGAGVLVGQALVRVVAAGAVDLRTWRAIGADRRLAVPSMVSPAGVTALVAAATTVLVAVLASPRFPIAVSRRYELDLGFHADWPVLSIAAAAVALAVLSAAWATAELRLRRSEAGDRIVGRGRRVVMPDVSPVLLIGSRLATEAGRGRRGVPVRSGAGRRDRGRARPGRVPHVPLRPRRYQPRPVALRRGVGLHGRRGRIGASGRPPDDRARPGRRRRARRALGPGIAHQRQGRPDVRHRPRHGGDVVPRARRARAVWQRRDRDGAADARRPRPPARRPGDGRRTWARAHDARGRRRARTGELAHRLRPERLAAGPVVRPLPSRVARRKDRAHRGPRARSLEARYRRLRRGEAVRRARRRHVLQRRGGAASGCREPRPAAGTAGRTGRVLRVARERDGRTRARDHGAAAGRRPGRVARDRLHPPQRSARDRVAGIAARDRWPRPRCAARHHHRARPRGRSSPRTFPSSTCRRSRLLVVVLVVPLAIAVWPTCSPPALRSARPRARPAEVLRTE